MKVRRIFILAAALLLAGGSAIFADGVSQKINVYFNKQLSDEQGLFIDGKTYVSVRSVSDKLKALVSWDDNAKELNVFNPNVNMMAVTEKGAFGEVPKGKNAVTFDLIAKVDNLYTDITALKLTIANPFGEETEIISQQTKDLNLPDPDHFWYRVRNISYTFESSGKYTIRFWMQPADGPMQVAAESVIYSK
jgi:hypothetical protein